MVYIVFISNDEMSERIVRCFKSEETANAECEKLAEEYPSNEFYVESYHLY